MAIQGIGSLRAALLTGGLAFLFGCSAESEPGDPADRSVAGQWCGVQVTSPEQCMGDEVFYVELVESGGQLSGQSCEDYETDCYPMLEPTVQGSRLTYAYEFSGYRVDADLTLSSDGTTLSGTFFSSKCGCELAVTLRRI